MPPTVVSRSMKMSDSPLLKGGKGPWALGVVQLAPRRDESDSPPLEGRCEKIGRASLLASCRPNKSLPREARREPRPPDLGRFLILSHLQGCRGGLFQTGRTHP
jgi:hypothetical protein